MQGRLALLGGPGPEVGCHEPTAVLGHGNLLPALRRPLIPADLRQAAGQLGQ